MSDKKRVVLVTGGTKGIGLATALRFAREGCQCVITYGWGSVTEEDVLKLFEGYTTPYLKQANVASNEDTVELLEDVLNEYGAIDTFVSNVAFSGAVSEMKDYSEKKLLKSIEYSSWPMVEYTKQMKKIMGKYPRYVIGISSHGPDSFHVNYDIAAATKSVMEVMVKYLNYHFFSEDVIFNVVRTRPVITESLVSIIGKDWPAFIEKYDVTASEVSTEDVAKVIFALTSGFMDGIRGQTINADDGYQFADGTQSFYAQRDELGLM